MLEQDDIYFDVPRGRLKLRRERGGPSHLIAYERSNGPGQRESRYRIVEIGDDLEIEAVLAASLGILAVVRKSRRLFLHQGVRIHLDRVEGLGCFIEFEAVATMRRHPDLTHFKSLLADLSSTFEIADADLIAGSYCDLTRARALSA